MIFPLPEIDFTRPLYIYGAGIMGISYKRQVEYLDAQSMLKGFVEDQPTMESYLGVPVIKRSDLTADQLNCSQFLIASNRLSRLFENNLLEQGCDAANIIFPLSLAWNGRSVLAQIEGDSRVCVYPVISSMDELTVICSRANKKQALFSGRGISLHVTVVVHGAILADGFQCPGVELVAVNSKEGYPREILEEHGVILLLNGNALSALDLAYHSKVYFYGISVLDSFARRLKGCLVVSQREKHKSLLKKIKGKGRIKVVFLAIHHSVWKVDSVFNKMLADPLFDPVVLVCPFVSYGDERMWDDLRQCCAFFDEKGYPFISAYKKSEDRWLRLDELVPDIVFFTNPHNLTRREYYQDAYLNYLSCYVPYHHEVCRYGGDAAQYNQNFHNALWRIFVPHEYSLRTYVDVAVAKGQNVVVSGYPAMEALIEKKAKGQYLNVWKSKDDRRRIIWAPHHTIVDVFLPYSNFLKYADAFRDLSESMKEKVVWSFKPHPLLKAKLYRHACWGREKTDAYYNYWENESHTQLDEGEYTDLFLSSDAMIHDSGSFLAEFLYAEKPVMYLLSENNQGEYYSEFGTAALKACEIGYCFEDVIAFVERLIVSDNTMPAIHNDFLIKEIIPYFSGEMPSERIVNEISKGIS
ncbi:CDP-glycerol glycerophosphotransferase family protein [Pseudomonas stutzeri]|uniref:CDP-Glycerol:Poly(Glycerophosphate) glycerophosphotransferase n=1 Tax=Stutzerimonas stutzeri TaxID=316 RepID=A0A2N8RZF0_STUST|nr:CDP-glycerol glycerophosphotransferase family protein [Stutzerimonas stutzeri]MCQ4295087.1 CDP-glycerol glycerophosphotransferase family protein [Stutzerimonas stutzeri]PNF79755.1 hypothetical protein CXK92_14040 [Stutzerimonas stutzeri]